MKGSFVLLEREQLAKGFTLKGKPYDIDFTSADDEIASVDLHETDGMPKVFKLSGPDQEYFKSISIRSPENRIRFCKDLIYTQLNRMNMVSAQELRAYIDRIVGDMDANQLSGLEKNHLYAMPKKSPQVETLLTAHYEVEFNKCLETEKIVCKPSWHFPASIFH